MSAREEASFVRSVLTKWSEDHASAWAAAVAYYAIFAIAPLLLVSVAIAGLVFGQAAAEGAIVRELEGLFGAQGARAVQTLLQGAARPGQGVVAIVAGTAVLLWAASSLFARLQRALHAIWGVRKDRQGVTGFLRERALAVAMVLGIGLLLLASLLASTVLSVFWGAIREVVAVPGAALVLADAGLSIALGTVLFALVFKVLPRVDVAWRDVWLGALVTALLFAAGKLAFGFYLGRANLGTTFGSLASLVVLLLWINYSAQVLFLGAEFTQLWARRRGRSIAPGAGATPAPA